MCFFRHNKNALSSQTGFNGLIVLKRKMNFEKWSKPLHRPPTCFTLWDVSRLATSDPLCSLKVTTSSKFIYHNYFFLIVSSWRTKRLIKDIFTPKTNEMKHCNCASVLLSHCCVFFLCNWHTCSRQVNTVYSVLLWLTWQHCHLMVIRVKKLHSVFLKHLY